MTSFPSSVWPLTRSNSNSISISVSSSSQSVIGQVDFALLCMAVSVQLSFLFLSSTSSSSSLILPHTHTLFHLHDSFQQCASMLHCYRILNGNVNALGTAAVVVVVADTLTL